MLMNDLKLASIICWLLYTCSIKIKSIPKKTSQTTTQALFCFFFYLFKVTSLKEIPKCNFWYALKWHITPVGNVWYKIWLLVISNVCQQLSMSAAKGTTQATWAKAAWRCKNIPEYLERIENTLSDFLDNLFWYWYTSLAFCCKMLAVIFNHVVCSPSLWIFQQLFSIINHNFRWQTLTFWICYSY